jgi:hypothetical protein
MNDSNDNPGTGAVTRTTPDWPISRLMADLEPYTSAEERTAMKAMLIGRRTGRLSMEKPYGWSDSKAVVTALNEAGLLDAAAVEIEHLPSCGPDCPVAVQEDARGYWTAVGSHSGETHGVDRHAGGSTAVL